MTKIQKKTFKKLSTINQKKDFLNFIINQQTFLGRFKHWEKVYEKKCIKKGLTLKTFYLMWELSNQANFSCTCPLVIARS